LVRDKEGQIETEVAVKHCQSRCLKTHQTKYLYKTTGTFSQEQKKKVIKKTQCNDNLKKKNGFGCHYSHAPTKCRIFAAVETTVSFRVTQVKKREYLQPNSTVGTTEYREQTTQSYFKYLRVLSTEIAGPIGRAV
jgi:hypothetical protein